MRAAFRLAILIGTIGLGTGACRGSRSGAASDSKAATVQVGPVVLVRSRTGTLPFRVELATTEPQRERGLMYRNHLDPDAGMLFVFDHEAPLTFWMKNTLIPLDMIFIGSDRHIVGVVENAAPETETPRRVGGLSRFVLEIPGGTAARLGIAPPDNVEFLGVPRELLGN